jgi:hypothetical protein
VTSDEIDAELRRVRAMRSANCLGSEVVAYLNGIEMALEWIKGGHRPSAEVAQMVARIFQAAETA